MILACGLARESARGGKPYDTFRNRVMFPIRDARGRCIAFGGRAMDPNDSAKYLNSPETELFDKSRTLYNHGPAREAAGKGAPLIVAEGYMDVIALVAAGFDAAMAPLGTAITADQLQLLWRIAPEPVIMLDGDRAGLDAAYRLIELALPLLEAGRTLRFARMPENTDPTTCCASRGLPRCRPGSTRRCRWCGCCGSARPKGRLSTRPSARRRWSAPAARRPRSSATRRCAAITSAS